MTSLVQQLLRIMPDDSFVSIQNPNQEIRFIEMLSRDTTVVNSETLYIEKPSPAIRDFRHTTLLLFSEIFPALDELPKMSNILLLQSEDDFNRLTNQAFRALNDRIRLSYIDNSFLKILREGGSLQKLLNYGCNMLGNPLLLVDVSFTYVASAGTKDLSNQYNWEHTLKYGILPSDYLKHIMETDTPLMDEYPEIIRTEKDEKNIYNSYSVKIVHKGMVYGYLKILERDSAFDDFARAVFISLGNYIGILTEYLINMQNNNTNQAEGLLNSIILERIDDAKAIETLRALVPIKFYNNLYLIDISFNEQPDPSDWLFFAQRRIRRFFPRMLSTRINDHFLVVYDIPAAEQPFAGKPEDRSQFLDMLKEIKCHANISLMFHDLKEISTYYQQVLFCREYRQKMNDTSPMLYYSDIFEYQMILSMGERISLQSLIHPALEQLHRIDNKNGSDLVHTLLVYIRHNCSIPATASEMYLHYNTVKHRIEKIVDCTNLDLSSKSELFRIELSEKIIKLLDHSF